MNGINNSEYFSFLTSYCVGLEDLDKSYKIFTSIYANQEFVSLKTSLACNSILK